MKEKAAPDFRRRIPEMGHTTWQNFTSSHEDGYSVTFMCITIGILFHFNFNHAYLIPYLQGRALQYLVLQHLHVRDMQAAMQMAYLGSVTNTKH
jgi:hypothetical protein